ncbi:hypothetical protein GCM10007939_08220 [Amylibacter marinus]|uniref:YjiS-like domain-containing protein n=1 Tax=Amylibacter marinus TaxID=1475483 RepID=A0ABQ5VT90_9RHOB|nr:DUF1127 domain-containing protein [Amylibacter marinus]GLQ34539.1 hypothetical protein GCM10007939_08220 [Amylibacter marinus]
MTYYSDTRAAPRTNLWGGLFLTLRSMQARSKQHRALRKLDAAALRDIGLTAQDVQTELATPLWKSTPHHTA